MATSAWSPHFVRLVNVWKLLTSRHDIDNLIFELLGHFSIEKIYAESDHQTYQRLVTALLVQLNAIFYVQRMSLPGADVQVSQYLRSLASWEVTARSVEFVLQTIVEGWDMLLTAQSLLDKYLPELLMSALRNLMLHPRPPVSPRARDLRNRYARIHQYLGMIFDGHPGPMPSLLSICRETTSCLCADPHALALPAKLKLPNLRSNMYPLADCLSSQYVSTIVPAKDPSGAWLPHVHTLRDVSFFVVGASIQSAANEGNIDLRATSLAIKEAVVRSLNDLPIPPYLSKAGLVAVFDDIFRLIPVNDSPPFQQNLAEFLANEDELDALDMLSAKLLNRQALQRTSDREMMDHISEVTRQIVALDDPIGHHQSTSPSLYAVNCPSSHLIGGSHMRHLENIQLFRGVNRSPTESGVRAALERCSCIYCGETVTAAREISLASNTWDLLKPLESSSNESGVERHLATSFQLSAPIIEVKPNEVVEQPNVRHQNDCLSQGNDPSPPYHGRLPDAASNIQDQILYTAGVISPTQVAIDQRLHSAQLDSVLVSQPDQCSTLFTAEPATPDGPFSPDDVGVRREDITQARQLDRFDSVVSGEPVPLVMSDLVTPSVPLVKRMSKWKPKWTVTRKNSNAASGDTSSLSSATLESQKLEELPLENLLKVSKSSLRGRNAKKINVYLSQNSTYALLWTQAAIHIWDVGISPPAIQRTFLPESSCVLAAVTAVHLAYIIGTRDQKLTLRIVNLGRPSLPVVEYRMSSSLWCRSIAICPKEDHVAVGFDNSIVRFFKLFASTEQPREDQLHARYHKDCRECPSVDTLSFSSDGQVLVASTRNSKSGTIQIYSWEYPFLDFKELRSCRYNVPLLESEDNGISSAIARSGAGEANLICITTWTQSGVPVLLQPQDGYKTHIKTDLSGRQGRLGNRIQCAAFSTSGRELAMVNDKGYLYYITSLDSTPMRIKRMATSIELTARSDAFAMTFMTVQDEDTIVLAWADMVKSVCVVKKIPVMPHGDISMPATPALAHVPSRFELSGDTKEIPKPPVELSVDPS